MKLKFKVGLFVFIYVFVGLFVEDAQAASFFDICRRETPQEVESAIKAGADVNAKDESGLTALMYAARFNDNPEVIQVLVKNGADVNAKNKNSETALRLATVYNSNPEVITALRVAVGVGGIPKVIMFTQPT